MRKSRIILCIILLSLTILGAVFWWRYRFPQFVAVNIDHCVQHLAQRLAKQPVPPTTHQVQYRFQTCLSQLATQEHWVILEVHSVLAGVPDQTAHVIQQCGALE